MPLVGVKFFQKIRIISSLRPALPYVGLRLRHVSIESGVPVTLLAFSVIMMSSLTVVNL